MWGAYSGRPEQGRVQGVTEALEVDTATLGKILGKAMSAWRAAEAAKKARELVRRKSVLTKSTLPGKLADCTTSDKAESEIFVVEGDSAGARCCPAAAVSANENLNNLRPMRAHLYRSDALDTMTRAKSRIF